VTLNLVEFEMDPLAAVSAPRFHCEGPFITLEGRFPASVAAGLARAGELVVVSRAGLDRLAAANVNTLATPAWPRPGPGPDPRSAGVAFTA